MRVSVSHYWLTLLAYWLARPLRNALSRAFPSTAAEAGLENGEPRTCDERKRTGEGGERDRAGHRCRPDEAGGHEGREAEGDEGADVGADHVADVPAPTAAHDHPDPEGDGDRREHREPVEEGEAVLEAEEEAGAAGEVHEPHPGAPEHPVHGVAAGPEDVDGADDKDEERRAGMDDNGERDGLHTR